MAAFLFRLNDTGTMSLGSGAPLPTVTGLSSATGGILGGRVVTIAGRGLSDVTAVTFDRPAADHPAAGTSLHVLSDFRITVLAPAHSAGTVTVRVLTEDGTSVPTKHTGYTYGPDLSIVAGRTRTPHPGAATSSTLVPDGIAVDRKGNLYIADYYNSMVEKVSPKGTISVIAGVGVDGAPTRGAAIASNLASPRGVAVDGDGNVYIADTDNNMVEKVTPSGVLSIVAGTGTAAPPVPGRAVASPLSAPSGLAVDVAGNLYISDSGNNVVEKVTQGGVLSIVAGTGVPGTPVPGPAISSSLYHAHGIAVDSGGNLYIADTGNYVVEKVTPDGVLSIVAGIGEWGPLTPGSATDTALEQPLGVAVDGSGNIYIADSRSYRVARVTPDGVLSVFAGGGRTPPSVPGPATATLLDQPFGVAVDAAGTLYIADTHNAYVEKVDRDGILSLVAGVWGSGSPTPGPAKASALREPSAVAVDAAGNFYIADTANDVIEKVTPAGKLSIFAGNGTSGRPTSGPATASALDEPTGVAVDATGNVYIADQRNQRVEKVTPAGVLSIFAGGGGKFPSITPGPATSYYLAHVYDVAVDSAGNVYIAHQNMVSKVTPDGILSVVAGGGHSSVLKPGRAIDADLGNPEAVTVDRAGNIYIADSFDGVVAKVTPAGMLSVVVGRGIALPPVPGPAADSPLRYPSGVVVGPAGNLYISDQGSNVVVKVTPKGILFVVIGSGVRGRPTPGLATATKLAYPKGLAVDRAGRLYVTDSGNNDIHRVVWH